MCALDWIGSFSFAGLRGDGGAYYSILQRLVVDSVASEDEWK